MQINHRIPYLRQEAAIQSCLMARYYVGLVIKNRLAGRHLFAAEYWVTAKSLAANSRKFEREAV